MAIQPKISLAISLIGLAFALVAVTVAGSIAGGHSAIYLNPVEPEATPQLDLGRKNYERFCVECHGKTARGTDKGPTFISRIYHPGHHGDQAFFVAPKRGARAHHWRFGDMKPVPGVTDADLESILRYVRAVQRANGVY